MFNPIFAGLLGCMLLTGIAEADVFVSVDAKGSYVLSNVHRPGRTYERVIHEPQMPVVSLDQQPQMVSGQPYAELVSAAASANQLPEALLHAVINVESHYQRGCDLAKRRWRADAVDARHRTRNGRKRRL